MYINYRMTEMRWGGMRQEFMKPISCLQSRRQQTSGLGTGNCCWVKLEAAHHLSLKACVIIGQEGYQWGHFACCLVVISERGSSPLMHVFTRPHKAPASSFTADLFRWFSCSVFQSLWWQFQCQTPVKQRERLAASSHCSVWAASCFQQNSTFL